MTIVIARRKFVTALGGAVAAWPFASHAEQGMRLVGILANPEIVIELIPFKDALRQLGWIEGRNIRFETRFNDSDLATRRNRAKELVALKPDLIYTSATPATLAVFAETRTIPILFVNASDPVGSGLAVSLAHPDGNVTGFTNFEATVAQKWLELLKEIAPRMTRAGVIFNPETAVNGGLYFFKPIETAARAQGIEATALPVRSEPEIERTFASLAGSKDIGLIGIPDTYLNLHRAQIVGLANRYAIPSAFGSIAFVRAGGLLAYDIDRIEQMKSAALYVDRILKGERPGDLPIQAPVKFTLAVNVKAAKSIGLEVPWFLQQRADELIE